VFLDKIRLEEESFGLGLDDKTFDGVRAAGELPQLERANRRAAEVAPDSAAQ